MNSLTMRIYLGRKRMFLSRFVIKLLGNPTHLNFWYDEYDGNLIVSPAEKDDMDAYEIPKYFWNGTKQSCEIARIAFLTALKYRIGWENEGQYIFVGSITESGNMPAAVFNRTFQESVGGKSLCRNGIHAKMGFRCMAKSKPPIIAGYDFVHQMAW